MLFLSAVGRDQGDSRRRPTLSKVWSARASGKRDCIKDVTVLAKGCIWRVEEAMALTAASMPWKRMIFFLGGRAIPRLVDVLKLGIYTMLNTSKQGADRMVKWSL